MKTLAMGVGLAVLAAAGLPGQELPPGVLLLARVKSRARANFEHMPNYMCQETVERFERPRNAGSFRRVDALHLEVASVGGKELLAWAGAKQFGDGDVAAYNRAGMLGTGAFAATPVNLFVHGNARISGSGEKKLFETSLRYEFEIPVTASGYTLQSWGGTAVVGTRGWFWVDAETLDLLRIEEHAADIPPALGMRDVETIIDYAPMRIGGSDVLLPRFAEMTVTDYSGAQRKNEIAFSGCREYGSVSVIRFEVTEPGAGAAKKK